VVDDVLVDRRPGADQDGDASCLAAACPAELLPRCRDRPWIAGQHGDVQASDIDAKLEGIRCHDAEHLVLAQAALDRSTLGREIAAAIPPDTRAWPEGFPQRLPQTCQQQLDGRARPAARAWTRPRAP